MNNYWILGASHGMTSARPCGEGATAFDRLALGMRTGREWPDRQLHAELGNWSPPERPECSGDMRLDIGPESVSADPGSPTHAASPDLERTAGTAPGICGLRWSGFVCRLAMGHPGHHKART